jgi:hypothetical protein
MTSYSQQAEEEIWDAIAANHSEPAEPAKREIPAGKVLLTEDVDDSNRARVSVLEERTAAGRTYRLVRSSPGFEPAGSCARWTNGYFAIRFEVGGAIHGRQFKTETEARALLETWARAREEGQ